MVMNELSVWGPCPNCSVSSVSGRVMQEAEIDVRLVPEELAEVVRRHREGTREDREQALAEALQGLEVRHHRRPHSLVALRPPILAA